MHIILGFLCQARIQKQAGVRVKKKMLQVIMLKRKLQEHLNTEISVLTVALLILK
jgi:hypothetical protein